MSEAESTAKPTKSQKIKNAEWASWKILKSRIYILIYLLFTFEALIKKPITN